MEKIKFAFADGEEAFKMALYFSILGKLLLRKRKGVSFLKNVCYNGEM